MNLTGTAAAIVSSRLPVRFTTLRRRATTHQKLTLRAERPSGRGAGGEP
jgi:hypothetical protein